MKPDPEDAELIRRYAEKQSEPAFAEHVRWHRQRLAQGDLRRSSG